MALYSASDSVSDGDSVSKSVSITSRMRTVSTTDWKSTPWSSSCAPIKTKNPPMMSQGLMPAATCVFGIASSASPATTAPMPSICPMPEAARVACATPLAREIPLRIRRPASSG